MGDTFKTLFPILSWIMEAMAPAATSDVKSEAAQGVKTNFRSTDSSLPIVYGKRRVGGNDAFMVATGTNNEFLWIVMTLAEGECDSIYQDGGVDQLFLDGEIYTKFGSYVNYTFSAGTSGQTVDTDLNTAYSEWVDTLRYTSYIVFKLEWDEDRESGDYNFQGIPERLVDLKGTKVIDIRNDPLSAAEWSDNPVLCLYDFMTNTRYGMGMDTDKFDVTSWTAAANYCDTKNFTLNMVVKGERKSGDVIMDILAHFRGNLVWFDNKFYCRYADLNYESAVLRIDDKDIVVDDDGTASVSISQPGRFAKPNMLEVTYFDEVKGYTEDTVSVGDSDLKPEKLTLAGCTDREMASNLAVYNLERMQLDRTISGTFRDHLVLLDPHDVVYFNSTALSIADTLMRVVESTVNSDGSVSLVMMYENLELYDDDYDTDITEVYQSSLPDPNEAPPGVANVAWEEELRFHRGRTYTDLAITFDRPTYVWWSHAEIWMSTTTDTPSAYAYQFTTTNDFKIENIREGDEVLIIIRSVSIWGAKQKLENSFKINTTIIGKNTAPSSVRSLQLIANDNAVNLYADEVDDPDIESYEFRFGASWSSGLFLAANRRPVYSLVGVKPGSHTFFVNTRGTNGIYGASPKSASVTIQIPGNWTAQTTCVDDYEFGIHTGTERILYDPPDYYLKNTHSVALSGLYVAPSAAPNECDGGADQLWYVWVDADVIVIGAGTAWQSKFTGTPGVSGTTWDEGGAANKSWSQIFELTEASQVEIAINYGDTTGVYPARVERMEILSTQIDGRYCQVDIKITDSG